MTSNAHGTASLSVGFCGGDKRGANVRCHSTRASIIWARSYIRWQSDADVVSFQCESGDGNRTAEFESKLMQIESKHTYIQEHFNWAVKLPAAEVQRPAAT